MHRNVVREGSSHGHNQLSTCAENLVKLGRVIQNNTQTILRNSAGDEVIYTCKLVNVNKIKVGATESSKLTTSSG